MSRKRDRAKTANLFKKAIRQSLKMPEEMLVSEWAERYRELDGTSNLSGRWSNNVTPYLNEIMNTINDEAIRETYFCKGSQIGGTEVLFNMIMYIIDKAPAPAMIVYPTDDLAKDISNTRLKPALGLTKQIREKFVENSSKELRLKFKSMNLYLRSGGSPSKLASLAIKYLFFDEIDKMGGASKKEASPYALAMERTKTYRSKSKVYACSTPTLSTNYIWGLHDNADEVRHYLVPCPHCHEKIELLWNQIKFDKDEQKQLSPYDRARTARYVCQKCGCFILDKEKPKMLREGEWAVIKKRGIGQAKSVGFWINSLYSIFLTWADVAEEFLKSKDDPEALQNFTNSWLAEPWEDTKLKTTAGMVLERQTDLLEMVAPKWTKLITIGVDVQQTSLYYVVRAFGEFSTSQLIAKGQVLSFSEIEKVINLEWTTEDGRKLLAELALIDSGYEADASYDFCIDNSECALPCKGSSNPMRDRYKISKVDKITSKAYGMQLVIIDGSQYKETISSRMRRENGVGSWMVYKGCGEEYAEQVTSEHKVATRGANGIRKTEWVKKKSHADNHYLDCEVYAFAAAEIRGVRTLHLQREEEEQQEQKKSEYKPEENWIENNDNWI